MGKLSVVAATGNLEATDAIDELASVRDELTGDLLDTMRGTHTLALAIRTLQENLLHEFDCIKSLLWDVDVLAQQMAAAVPGPSAEFGFGLYLSETVSAGRDGSLFGSSTKHPEHIWVRDAKGVLAPQKMVLAEAALVHGEQLSSGSKQVERAIMRGERLLIHAHLLAAKKLDHSNAARWRYLEAAQLASRNGHPLLAARALALLSHLLMRKGQQQEALDAASKALGYADEPLAKYMQATLRRALGELRTTIALHEAETLLATVAGKLHTVQLETERAELHAEMVQWRRASNASALECLGHGDVAKVTLCVLGKFFLS
jgi:hypothetical protein